MKVQQPPVNFTVSDPNNVPKTFVSGPVNLSIGPEISTMWFARATPNADLLMKGQIDPNPKAILTTKLVWATSALRAFHTTLGYALANQAVQASGATPNGGFVVPGSDGNH